MLMLAFSSKLTKLLAWLFLDVLCLFFVPSAILVQSSLRDSGKVLNTDLTKTLFPVLINESKLKWKLEVKMKLKEWNRTIVW